MIVTTSSFKMNAELFHSVLKLFQEYLQCEELSAEEFIEAKFQSPAPPMSNDEIEKLVLLVAHRHFLEAVKNNVVSHFKLRNYNEMKMTMIIFFILFASEGASAEDMFNVLKRVKCAFKQKLLKYFRDEDNLIRTALTGCKFFEDEYVLTNVINPVLGKAEVLKQVVEYLDNDKASKYAKKPPTVPDQINVLQKKKPTPAAPLNTPTEFRQFEAREIPRTLYTPDSVNNRIMGEFEKNRLKAQHLLAQAKSLSKNYCKPKKIFVTDETSQPRFKAKKAPRVREDVEIKGNVAAVLREASLCIKEHEKEIKDIETILKGGSTLETFKELEKNSRKLEQQKYLEDIERKHLEGLLTFEESILAKKKLLECNKERFRQFMQERERLLRKIDQWREKEQEKIKKLVKKCQIIERKAKESELKVREEKRSRVNQFKNQTKKMLQEAMEKQKTELAKKVKLIEEIKTLQQLKAFHQPKEFDPSDCPNLGLLCGMSIADLQKKLAEMKIKMQAELEQKRRCIKKYKERQKQMIENVKNFVAQARMSKPKQPTVPIRPTKLEHNPDLDKLKSQLEYARELRKNVVRA